ncbi:MAG: GNAT family N-acetyltransferase [Dongiaceae bacterium]
MVEVIKIETAPQMAAAFFIRARAFIIGQKVPADLEIDEHDATATHYLAYVNGIAAATARVRFLGDGVTKIQRVATLEEYRGQGVGQALMQKILEDLSQEGIKRVTLNAQSYVVEWYKQFGFTPTGNEFFEADIPHYTMEKDLAA